MMFSGKYTARDGGPLTRTITIAGLPAQERNRLGAAARRRIGPRPSANSWTFAFAKRFVAGPHALEGTIDIFNLLNANHVLGQNEAVGSTVGRPSRILRRESCASA